MNVTKPHVALRPAIAEDAAMVFRWRNDPFFISRGSSQKSVTWDEHQRWFEQTVTGTARRMFIVLIDGVPAGQARCECLKDEFIMSVYLLQPFTGRGLGVEAIRQACQRVFAEWQGRTIVAFVRQDNPHSQAAFRKAGFQEGASVTGCPPDHVTLILRAADHQAAKAAIA